MKFIAADSLSEAVCQRVHSVGVLLDEYEALLPQAACQRFLTGIRLLLSAVGDYHQEWRDHVDSAYLNSPTIRADLLRSVSTSCLEVLGNIQEELLPLLEVSLRQPPFLIQPTFEQAVSALARRKTFELTIVPAFGYQYGFYGKCDFVQSALSKLGHFSTRQSYLQSAEKLPQWSFFLTYPIVERESALNQVVIIHEFAHLINELRDVHVKLLPKSLDKDSFDAYVSKVTQKQAKETPPDIVESECFAQCSSILELWTKEIVSDILAIHAAGPAYLFAFLEFFANSAMEDLHDKEHPVPSYRCEILLGELAYLQYFDNKSAAVATIRKLLAEMRPGIQDACNESVRRYDQTVTVIHKTIESNRSSMLAKLRKLARKFSYSAGRYATEVPPLITQLRQAIVPSCPYSPGENPAPLSIPSILNAGWQLYRSDLQSFYALFDTSVRFPERLMNLNRLIFKSLESNEVVTRYFS